MQIVQSSDGREVVSLVLSGFVRKYWITNNGSAGVVIVYGPGDIFPLTLVYKKLFNQILYKGSEIYFYETISDCRLKTLDTYQIQEAVKRDPSLLADLFQEAGRHLEYCIHALENVSLPHSEKRLAHQLIYFARKFGSKTAQGVRLDIPFTHQELADILSLTRETVSTSIIQLRKKNLIKTGKYITIPSLARLEKEAYN